MKGFLLVLILFSIEALAFNKDFTLVNDRAPLEFRVLFETMKANLKEPADQVRLVAYCERINNGLAPLKRDQAFFLFKSEIYKTLLEWRFPNSHFQPNPHSLKRIRDNLENGRSVYTPFAQWVLESLTADYVPFEKSGVFNLSAGQQAALTGVKMQDLLKLKRVMRFTRGWLEAADNLSIADFNALTQELAWRVLERVNEKAQLFSRFSAHSLQNIKVETFNIPQTAMPSIQKLPGPSAPLTPSAQGKAVQEAAKASVDKIQVTPADVPSEEMSEAIDKVEVPADSTGGAAPPALE